MTDGPPTGSWNPWAPRAAPDGTTQAPPAPSRGGAPLAPTAPTAAARPPRPAMPLVSSPSSPPAERFHTGPAPRYAPVADDGRPPGLHAAPPTSWPTPRVGPEHRASTERPHRSAALVAFVAFLVGALVMGGAFASYAWGARSHAPAKAKASSTASASSGRSTQAPVLDIRKVLGDVEPSVVTILTGSSTSIFGSAGSGVVLSADGLILTNDHVIDGAEQITIRFSDGTSAQAKVVGASKSHDVAVLRVPRTDLTPAKLGSTANVRVGDDVVAIGNALNLGGDPSVTRGIVSAKDRSIDDGKVSLQHLIQTDAAINHGNSGGPLVDAQSEVIGINTAGIEGAQNIGFAIAIDSVRDLITQLEHGKGGDTSTNAAHLGLSALDVSSPEISQDIKDHFRITAKTGAVVIQVDPSGAAAKAGIEEGDVIISFDGSSVTTDQALSDLIGQHRPGEQVNVVVERRGQRQSFQVTLGR